MNTTRIITTAQRSIFVLMFLIGGLGFTQARGNNSAVTEEPEPYLVKDIITKGTGNPPRHLTNVNGTLYFYVDDGVHGWELWKSDGTAEGTALVKDINPGSGDSCSGSECEYSELTAVNGTLYFNAEDGVNGIELWKSDGSADGTVLVKDINSGGDGLRYSADLTDMNGTLYFNADDGVHGEELWKSDGTADGTVLVKDISLGGTSSVFISNPNSDTNSISISTDLV
jgi:ELWxxDGT repeat protein